MSNLRKLALGAIVATGVAVSFAAPAEAGVSVGIGIGVPGPVGYWHGNWCSYHPYRCGYPARVGYYGWHRGGYWGHPGWYRSHWHHWR